MTRIRDRITTVLLLIGLGLCLVTGCEGDLGFDEASPPQLLTGRVQLQNQSNHYAVKVTITLDEVDLVLITDVEGLYVLPPEMTTGTWDIQAGYPFFGDISQAFEVKNGLPTAQVQDMLLPQVLTFEVTTEQYSYSMGEAIPVFLNVSNTSDQEVILKSGTSPMLTYAIRKDGQVLVGSLLPGDGALGEEVVLGPGEVRQFETTWHTDSLVLEGGVYQIYALLAASETYPDYFDPETPELNESLYEKLPFAEVEVLP